MCVWYAARFAEQADEQSVRHHLETLVLVGEVWRDAEGRYNAAAVAA